MSTNKNILIVGGGTFGLSTAYHLAKSGYKHITVLEKSTSVPSEYSAGNDLNKIVRAEYEDPFYAKLALEAIQAWQKPLFSPHYRQVGYLLATSPAAPEKAKATLQRSLQSISGHPAWSGKIVPLNERADIARVAPKFDGPMPWTGYFNRLAGYAQSADALCALYSACCALGVEIHLGEQVEQLNFEANGVRCTGARSTSGRRYFANTTIVTVGASVPKLLPSIAKQIKAVGFPVAHIQLRPLEAERLRGIPVTYVRDLGYFFEPDRRNNILKICSATAGYTWFASSDGVSTAPSKAEDSAIISKGDEEAIRELLRQAIPSLADRPLQDTRVCWCADSADTDYVIDFVPEHEGLIVASGDSAHGFKMLPVFGGWVKKVIEGGKQSIPQWRWKEVELKGDEGVSWRIGTRRDLKEVWNEAKICAKL